MKAAVLLSVLGAASLVNAETCSGFETRLTNLANQVQAMIDIVEAMQPTAGLGCGGIVGAKVYGAVFMSTIFTDGRAGVTDNSAHALSPGWCCDQCKAASGCQYWSLQFAGVKRCQLYSGKALASRTNAYDPSGFLFMQALGVGAGVNRVSGRLPVTGTWGSQTSATGQAEYMINTATSGSATYIWRGDVTPAMAAITGGIAEGFEMCDTIGPYKPTFLAGNGANNGHAITYYARDPLECCSICVRNVAMNGGVNDKQVSGANVWASKQCALWAYNYDTRKRHCRVRQNTYAFDGTNALTTIDLKTNAGLTSLQNAAQCSPTDVGGNPRFYPDGTTPCAGAFGPTQWSTGMPWASALTAVPLA